MEKLHDAYLRDTKPHHITQDRHFAFLTVENVAQYSEADDQGVLEGFQAVAWESVKAAMEALIQQVVITKERGAFPLMTQSKNTSLLETVRT